MNYITELNSKIQVIGADDELEAAKRAVASQMLPRGANYTVRVCENGERRLSPIDCQARLAQSSRGVIVDAPPLGHGRLSARYV